jgi:flagellar hook-length control protein FliK
MSIRLDAAPASGRQGSALPGAPPDVPEDEGFGATLQSLLGRQTAATGTPASPSSTAAAPAPSASALRQPRSLNGSNPAGPASDADGTTRTDAATALAAPAIAPLLSGEPADAPHINTEDPERETAGEASVDPLAAIWLALGIPQPQQIDPASPGAVRSGAATDPAQVLRTTPAGAADNAVTSTVSRAAPSGTVGAPEKPPVTLESDAASRVSAAAMTLPVGPDVRAMPASAFQASSRGEWRSNIAQSAPDRAASFDSEPTPTQRATGHGTGSGYLPSGAASSAPAFTLSSPEGAGQASAGAGSMAELALNETGPQPDAPSAPVAQQAMPALQASERALPERGVTLEVSRPVGTPGWKDEFAGKVAWSVSAGTQSAELHLTPAELGPVRLAITLEADGARISIAAEHAHARQAIEDALPRLREMLAESGIRLDGFSVGQGSPGQEERQQAYRDASGRGAANTLEDVPEPRAEPPLPAVSRAGIGLVDTYA